MSNGKVIVHLDPWEYERAGFVALRRGTSNWGRPDSAAYKDKEKQEPNRRAEFASCLCELAVAKHLNQYWSGSVWSWKDIDPETQKTFPDVGHNIEVRRVRSASGPAVKKKDKDKFVYGAKVIGDEWMSVEILGWVVANDYIKDLKGRKYLSVPVMHLNSPTKKTDC